MVAPEVIMVVVADIEVEMNIDMKAVTRKKEKRISTANHATEIR